MSQSPEHVCLICSKCQLGVSLETLKAKLAGLLPDTFVIRTVDCMAGCDMPRTVGFQAIGKAQYLFGPIETDEDIAALVEFAAQYCASADGWSTATERPRALYNKTLSRLPKIDAVPA